MSKATRVSLPRFVNLIHSRIEKVTIWKLLNAEANTGAKLTENFAMTPGNCVSGFYFAHPDAKYTHAGPLNKDQFEEYSERKGQSLEETERCSRQIWGISSQKLLPTSSAREPL